MFGISPIDHAMFGISPTDHAMFGISLYASVTVKDRPCYVWDFPVCQCHSQRQIMLCLGFPRMPVSLSKIDHAMFGISPYASVTVKDRSCYVWDFPVCQCHSQN